MAAKPKQITTSAIDTHITSSEWRWVIGMGAIVLIVTSLPLLWALWVDMREPDFVFMGVLSNPLDGATYLSKIQVGTEGHWRTIFRHSPGIEQGAYVSLIYNGLGQFSRYLNLSNVFVFHTARLLTSMLMFLALYQFASVIWQRRKTRRNFFVLVTIGSGLGWLLILFGLESADLVIPEAYPLYSAVSNVHFPLAFAFLSIAAGLIVVVFRPGFKEDPSAQNGGWLLFLCALGLAIIAPHALVPFASAIILLMAIDWVRQRRVYTYQFRWFMLIVLPALPLGVYYIAEVYYNDVVQMWTAQNITLSPTPLLTLAGVAVPLIIALPGIYRAIRRFEPDGDQFMLLWLVMILVMAYAPLDSQRRFTIGIMIPIAYFAVRALTDFWLDDRSEVYRGRFVAMIYGLSSITYVMLFLVWLHGANSVNNPLFYLSQSYDDAFAWLENETERGTVILGAERVSLWIPGHAGMSVIYAHPYESFDAGVTKPTLHDWYQEENADAVVCDRLIQNYNVAYVLVGPQEVQDAGGETSSCVENLTAVQQFGDVNIYTP